LCHLEFIIQTKMKSMKPLSEDCFYLLQREYDGYTQG
jgi:hypothetical protein